MSASTTSRIVEGKHGIRQKIYKFFKQQMINKVGLHGLGWQRAAGGNIETGQMSSVDTGHLSSVETRQMSQQSSVRFEQQTYVLSQQKTSTLFQLRGADALLRDPQ